jgi:hypothetical protein
VSGWILEALIESCAAEVRRARSSSDRQQREAIGRARLLAAEIRRDVSTRYAVEASRYVAAQARRST